jgi:peroxiredoxin
MKRLTQNLLIGAVALAAATAGFALNKGKGSPEVDPATGAKLMALSLPDPANKPHAFAQWKGKVIVANFWATWCPPCREEIPGFERLSRKWADKGVQFVGISIDSADKVQEFAKEHKVSYPLLIAGFETLQIATAMGNKSQVLPFTAVLDREGATRFVKLGQLSEKDLEAVLTKLK